MIPTRTLEQINEAARKAVRDGMILDSEKADCVRDAIRSLETSGSVYISGTTIRLSLKQQDEMRASQIGRMSAERFDRFAYGL